MAGRVRNVRVRQVGRQRLAESQMIESGLSRGVGGEDGVGLGMKDGNEGWDGGGVRVRFMKA